MAKWKLFGKSKSEEEKIENQESSLEGSAENIQTEENTQPENELEADFEPLADYNETLYSKNSKSKKGSSKKGNNPSVDQIIWRDVKTIEENIDNLHTIGSRRPISELDEKVDKLIDKSKKK